MAHIPKHTHIAYRCPECGTMIFGLVGEFALSSSMLRLKCSCGKSNLDITVTNDKKLRLSVPCVFCKQNHNFVVSSSIFFGKDLFLLNCPYASMDIGFIGEKEKLDEATKENEKQLAKLISDMGAEALGDIQPQDLEDDEILPDPAAYDLIRFLVKDLEGAGGIDCPCHEGPYDIRYAPEGIEAYCEGCGATYLFSCASLSAAEEYLGLDAIELK